MSTGTTKIDRLTLIDAVKLAKKHVGSRNYLSALTGMVLAVDGDTATLEATDLDVGIRVTLPVVEAGEPGRWLLDGKQLDKSARITGDTLGLEPADDDRLTLRGDSIEVTVKSPESATLDDFPDLPPVDSERVDITAEQLERFAQVASMAGTDTARPVLCGVQLTSGFAVATDSWRLPIATGPEGLPEALVPARVVTLASKLEDVTVAASGDDAAVDHVRFAGTHVAGPKSKRRKVKVEYFCSLIDGQFPSWRDLVPDGCDTRATLTDVDAVLDALNDGRKVNRASSTKNVPVKVEVNGSWCMSSTDRHGADWSATLPAEVEGPGVTIAFRDVFLADAIEATRANGEVAAEFRGELKPAVFRSDGLDVLVMPMRIN